MIGHPRGGWPRWWLWRLLQLLPQAMVIDVGDHRREQGDQVVRDHAGRLPDPVGVQSAEREVQQPVAELGLLYALLDLGALPVPVL
ncbi:MAG TPA: hypothetical protein VKI99_13480, partial [Candidatus Dormibacteraeota bacterium]|nr:hypothetical protein [Candidatus Dormibacteraeota bacterium]